MKRRMFIFAAPGAAVGLSAIACGKDKPFAPVGAYVDMAEDPESVRAALRNMPDLITYLAKHPGKDNEFRVQDASGETVSLWLGYHRDHEGNWRFAFTRKDGRRAFVNVGLLSGLRILDEQGNSLKAAGKPAAYPLPAAKPEQWVDPEQWIQGGIVVAGLALAAWLGLSAIGFVASGLGTIAIAGLVIGGAILAVGVVEEIMERIGWTVEDFRALFAGSLDALLNMVAGAVQQFRLIYSV